MLRLLVLILCLSLAPAARGASESVQVVEGFHAALIDLMKHGETLGCEGRRKQIEPVIVSTFDLPSIARQILRRRWDKLTPEQQALFTDTLRGVVVLTYASNFSSDGGVSFRTVDAKDLERGRREVRTQLIPQRKAAVSLDYFLHQADGQWRVINVIADGVSDLALRSVQYDGIYAQAGFDGLIARLLDQIAKKKAC
jgi:phospholipid transport system substrate-binding protein